MLHSFYFFFVSIGNLRVSRIFFSCYLYLKKNCHKYNYSVILWFIACRICSLLPCLITVIIYVFPFFLFICLFRPCWYFLFYIFRLYLFYYVYFPFKYNFNFILHIFICYVFHWFQIILFYTFHCDVFFDPSFISNCISYFQAHGNSWKDSLFFFSLHS